MLRALYKGSISVPQADLQRFYYLRICRGFRVSGP